MNRIGQKKFSSDENNDYHSAFMQKSKYVLRKACFYIKKKHTFSYKFANDK